MVFERVVVPDTPVQISVNVTSTVDVSSLEPGSCRDV